MYKKTVAKEGSMNNIENIGEVIDKIPENLVIYGYLFTVANKIQASGDKVMEGLTMRQQFLLTSLSLFEDYAPTLQELAQVFGSSYQNVKRMASQLEEKNYLEIKKDPIDRRKIRIILNQKQYNDLQKSTGTQTKDFMKKLYKGLDQKTLDTVARSLVKMNENLEEMYQ